MADVSALFAARKNKKKKKKTNAVSLLERERAYDMDMDAEGEFIDYEEDGGELTLPTSNEDDFGTWVEDEEENSNAKSKFLLTGKKTKEVLDIQDLELADKKEEPVVEDSETKREFHRARQQALAAAAASSELETTKEPEKLVKQVYRPRQVLEAKAKVSGEAALKHMDNEEYFPSLGAASKKTSKASVTKSAWGKVELKVEPQHVAASSHEAPIYLEADFIPALKHEGRKPGYVFASRDLGTGYYWEGGEMVREQSADKEILDKSESSEELPIDASTSDENRAEAETTKNAEAHKDLATEPVTSALDEDEDEMLAELAKLKKKKKKKKKDEEAVNDG